MLHPYIKFFFRKSYLMLLLFLLLLAGYGLALHNVFSAFPSLLKGQIWTGYYTVLIKNGADFSAVLKKLEPLPVIAKQTVRFRVNGFDSYREVYLKDLEEEFESIDPRLDPYIKSIPGFFEVDEEWEICYIPADWPLFVVDARLESALDGKEQDWQILDSFSLRNKLWSLVLGIVFFAGVFLLKRKRDYPVLSLLCFLPWLLLLRTGDPFYLLALYLLYPGCVFIIERSLDVIKQKYLALEFETGCGEGKKAGPDFYHPHIRSIKVTAFYLAGALLLLLTLWLIQAIRSRSVNTAVLELLQPLGISLLIPCLYTLGFLLKQKYQEHPTFLDIPIQRPFLSSFFRVPYVLPLCLLWLITPVVFGPKTNGPVMDIPFPETVNGLNTLSWQTLAGLWQTREEHELPNLATYLAHCYFQEGLLYGLGFDFPVADRQLKITGYREDELTGKIEAFPRVVKDFDDRWMAEQLARPASTGIEQLFIHQQKPVRVLRKAGNQFINHYPSWFYGACLIFLIVSIFLVTPGRQIFGYMFILLNKLQTKLITVRIHTDFFSRLQNLVWMKKERKKWS